MTPEEAWDSSKCPKCQKNEAQDDHTCPFAGDIHDDHETLCNCCDQCTQDCADDI